MGGARALPPAAAPGARESEAEQEVTESESLPGSPRGVPHAAARDAPKPALRGASKPAARGARQGSVHVASKASTRGARESLPAVTRRVTAGRDAAADTEDEGLSLRLPLTGDRDAQPVPQPRSERTVVRRGGARSNRRQCGLSRTPRPAAPPAVRLQPQATVVAPTRDPVVLAATGQAPAGSSNGADLPTDRPDAIASRPSTTRGKRQYRKMTLAGHCMTLLMVLDSNYDDYSALLHKQQQSATAEKLRNSQHRLLRAVSIDAPKFIPCVIRTTTLQEPHIAVVPRPVLVSCIIAGKLPREALGYVPKSIPGRFPGHLGDIVRGELVGAEKQVKKMFKNVETFYSASVLRKKVLSLGRKSRLFDKCGYSSHGCRSTGTGTSTMTLLIE